MSAIVIRDANAGDTRAIASVIVPIQQEEFGVSITYEQQPDLVDIAGWYQIGGGGFWVAETGGDIVGTIALKDIGYSQGALRKMFVKQAFRGASLGVAKGLLDHLLHCARERGFKTVFLGTTPQFLAAHRFYKKNGFVQVEESALPPAFPRMDVDKRFYRLDL